jgi:hypothetical protein
MPRRNSNQRVPVRPRLVRDTLSTFAAKSSQVAAGLAQRVVRDIRIAPAISVHGNGPARAKILGNPRSRVVRDSSNASSTISRISARNSGNFGTEAGA